MNMMSFVRFQVLTAASMMFRAVFWVVLLCKMMMMSFVYTLLLHFLLDPCSVLKYIDYMHIEVEYKNSLSRWRNCLVPFYVSFSVRSC
jgi:hypothetical protein